MDEEAEPSERRLALEPRDQIVGEGDPLQGRAENELPRVQDERLLLDLDQLGEVRLLLLHVDVRMTGVVEHAERSVHMQVDRRWLDARWVERVDQDVPRVDLLADGAVGEDHSSILVALGGTLRDVDPGAQNPLRCKGIDRFGGSLDAFRQLVDSARHHERRGSVEQDDVPGGTGLPTEHRVRDRDVRVDVSAGEIAQLRPRNADLERLEIE